MQQMAITLDSRSRKNNRLSAFLIRIHCHQLETVHVSCQVGLGERDTSVAG
jgi:hypothetical protein